MSHGNGGEGVKPQPINLDDLLSGKAVPLHVVADREWQVRGPRPQPLEAFLMGATFGALAMLIAGLWILH